LEPLDYIHAFYEGGAVAFKRVDEWSDIDLYLVVDDERVSETFAAVEKTLESLSPIRQKYDVLETGWLGVSQAFYRLENTSEYLIVDLAVLKLSSPDKFLEPEIHGNAVFYFNKSDKITPKPLNREAFGRKLYARKEKLQARFSMFNNSVQKEINRGNLLEAIDLYHVVTLGSLVEVLRMKHNPLHYDFKMRYVHYELPPEVVRKLEHLYFVKDKSDLEGKYQEAINWFNEIIPEIDRQRLKG